MFFALSLMSLWVCYCSPGGAIPSRSHAATKEQSHPQGAVIWYTGGIRGKVGLWVTQIFGYPNIWVIFGGAPKEPKDSILGWGLLAP